MGNENMKTLKIRGQGLKNHCKCTVPVSSHQMLNGIK